MDAVPASDRAQIGDNIVNGLQAQSNLICLPFGDLFVF
jgi:hypothetical protein